MFDTIFIGTTGLLAHAKGLRVVGNNLANVNTPGFKSSQLAFTEMFDNGGGSRQALPGNAPLGTGVESAGTYLNFKEGTDQGTGAPLDLKIDGNGFYVIKREGELLYTRAGDFRFTEEGVLVNTAGDLIQALDANGNLTDVTLEAYTRSVPKASSEVKIAGNLSATPTTPPASTTPPTLQPVNIFDQNGTPHPLKLSFQSNGNGDFTVSVSEGTGPVLGTGNIKFAGGLPVAGSDKFDFTYTPAGGEAMTVKFDFSGNVTALVSATTLSVASVDGNAPGVRSDQSIKPDGTLIVHFSNGQQVEGARLALANFDSDRNLEQVGGSAFRKAAAATVAYGTADSAGFGVLLPGHREGSNVDLAEEFSNLILMQRGYQASSHVISTANDMIQQLFDMKGR